MTVRMAALYHRAARHTAEVQQYKMLCDSLYSAKNGVCSCAPHPPATARRSRELNSIWDDNKLVFLVSALKEQVVSWTR